MGILPPPKKNKVALTKTALLTILSTLTKSTFHQLVLKTRYEEAWSWPGLWYWGYLVMIFMYAPHCPRHAEDVWDHWVPFFDDSQTLPSMAFSFFRGILWVEHVWKVADSCSTNGWFNYHCLLCSWGSPYCVVLKKTVGRVALKAAHWLRQIKVFLQPPIIFQCQLCSQTHECVSCFKEEHGASVNLPILLLKFETPSDGVPHLPNWINTALDVYSHGYEKDRDSIEVRHSDSPAFTRVVPVRGIGRCSVIWFGILWTYSELKDELTDSETADFARLTIWVVLCCEIPGNAQAWWSLRNRRPWRYDSAKSNVMVPIEPSSLKVWNVMVPVEPSSLKVWFWYILVDWKVFFGLCSGSRWS